MIPKDKHEARMEYLFRSLATGAMSKAHGGHYLCLYERLYGMIRVMLGEAPDPRATWRELAPIDEDEDVMRPDDPAHPFFLQIKTHRGWQPGFYASNERKTKKEGSTR
jgi:hypothetical protein